MSKTINPDDISSTPLRGYISTIQQIHNYKSISYKKIQKELKGLYDIDVDLDRIEENCEAEELSADIAQQYKNLSIR
mgnify:CR=1 FL=1